MKRISTILCGVILAITSFTTSLSAAESPVFSDEVLNYKVMFKWGFISKVAGYATLELKTSPTQYEAQLFARSAPWADNIYSLRDTLYTTMSPSTMLPSIYEYIAHEKGRYTRDTVKFTHTGNNFTGYATRERLTSAGTWSTVDTTLHATGPTVDLLSLFFYIRAIDFPRMAPGTSRSLNCFSGKKCETLTVTYNGMQKITVQGTEHLTYYVSFTFTQNGKTSSQPIYAWVTADNKRTPVQVEGTLPVGKIRVVLAN